MDTTTAPAIAMQPVMSSQIHSIGHDPETDTLAIRFKAKVGPGSLYHYAGFTADDFAKFQAAESKGCHFRDHIKVAVAKHPFRKVVEAGR